jgi:hypothetical protein
MNLSIIYVIKFQKNNTENRLEAKFNFCDFIEKPNLLFGPKSNKIGYKLNLKK